MMMKKSLRIAAAALVLAAAAAFSALAGTGSAVPAAASKAAVSGGQIYPENLEAAGEADQLVLVVGTGGCNGDVYYYKKAGQGQWELAWKEAAIVGRNGISWEKAEGDGKTPAGTYRFTMAFGLKEDPGTVLGYHRIDAQDYWVDDPESLYYNQLVNTRDTASDWDSAEHMAASKPAYNYGLALSYNEERVPGKGSAIFLHCFTASPDKGSAGCIRLPEERARELLSSVTEDSRVVIVPELSQLK